MSSALLRQGWLDRPGRRWLRLDPVGLVMGTAFAMLAMTPSLLPRDWLFQGLVSGVSAAAWYGVGVLVAWSLRRWSRWQELSERVRKTAPWWVPVAAWRLLLLAIPAGLLVMLAIAAQWQRQVAVLVGIEQTTTGGWLRAGPLLVVVAGLLLATARGIRWLARQTGRQLGRWTRLPHRVASVAGAALAGFALFTVVDDVMLQQTLSLADSAFSSVNTETFPGVEQPQSATRSGSPASLVPWHTLGREGRRFVAAGRSPEQLREASGRAPLDPVRVYVGLESARTPQDQADLAVADLERAGGFDRAVLLVVTTTGSGWINSAAADSLELMYGGDTAVVATQYSYLPSWLSFVGDRSRAEEAGRLLFDTVSARVALIPQGRRPLLLVYGESLGSQGSENAFSTLADIRAQADGVLWAGPLNSNRLWRSLVERRDPGTPEVEPVYASGLVVRFAGDAAQIHEPVAPWAEPRVLYLQHPSDPVVWWSTDLLLDRPDWLVEPRGYDVSPSMSWYPIVTFWQVTADMTNAQSVPGGHGHRYNDLILDGWAAVAPPDGWTPADTERVRGILTS